jgi:hypothetical protein
MKIQTGEQEGQSGETIAMTQ